MSTLDAVLNKNAADLNKELEVQRVMRAFKLNPYDVLDVPFGATETEVKRKFRKTSLMIHPDKFKHENGPEAESQLSDAAARREIDAIMTHARTLVLKNLIPVGYATVTDTDPRLANLKPSYDVQIRTKAKQILLEDAMARERKTKIAFANEGAEKAKLDEAVAKRKREAEDKVKWEEHREQRVNNWREYASTGGKPKKAKKNSHVLG
ncbi:uncharacterized protein MKK02DRAFT_38034 [Dioszegia hungarica]|uniref:J domain-containing protein n=1 Tax=Dioszegia hungarica TaxID=4972 RepID=A0AA38H5Q5_9TREE|nr:uncharacterized protein MKK02DRAFT_38034 [Dioszegia hungarica]KAI9634503.1 hypothetical protein MKK02DRAFT_38034 [Dioszegia hungarica]